MLRLEGSHLQVDDNKAAQSYVVEEQIKLEVFAADFERLLAANKGEADTEFKQEFAEVLQ